MSVLEGLHTFQRWAVDKILNFLDKYLISISPESAKMALMKGKYTFENLELNGQTIEEDFDLPFHITSGRVERLSIEIPWYRIFKNVTINVKLIEIEIKFKKSKPYKTREHTNSDKVPKTEKSWNLSYTEKYRNSMICRILKYLSFTCDDIKIKLIEDDIEFHIDIKSFTLSNSVGCDDWEIKYNLERLEDNHWKLQKMGDIFELTVSVNRINKLGNNYLEPMLSNYSLSFRLRCKFYSSRIIKPYLVHLDIFGPKTMVVKVKKEHMLLIAEFLNSIKKYRSSESKRYDESSTSEDNTENILNSISEIISSTENWSDWLSNWIRETNNDTIGFQLVNIGIYITSSVLLFDFGVPDSLNKYTPTIKCTFYRLLFRTVYHALSSTVIQLRFGGMEINSENNCACGHLVCANNKKLYFSSNNVFNNNYLKHSLFEENINVDGENHNVSIICCDSNGRTTTTATNSLEIEYVINYKPMKPSNITIATNVFYNINLTRQLIREISFILDFFSDHKKSLKVTEEPKDDEQSHIIKGTPTGDMMYNFKIPNILIHITPVCRNSISVFKKTKLNQTVDSFPEILVEFNELGGSVIIDHFNNNVIKQTITPITKYNLWLDKIEVSVSKSDVKRKLLYVNGISWIIKFSGGLENENDSLFTIESIKFESLKDDYLFLYYMVYTTFETNNQRNYMNEFIIFNAPQNNKNLNSALFVWTFHGVLIHRITDDNQQTYNLKVELRNTSANIKKFGESEQLWSKILSVSNESADGNCPAFHAIIQIPNERETIHLPLISVNVTDVSIYVDPLVVDWLTYSPGCTMRIQESDVSSSSVSEKQQSILFQMLKRSCQWELTPVFINVPTIALYFSDETVPTPIICDELVNVEQWIRLVAIDCGIDVSVMSISSFALDSKNHCALQLSHSSIDDFPVCYSQPISLWTLKGKSLMSWNMELKRLECFRFLTNKIDLFDAIDISSIFTLGTTTAAYGKHLLQFDGTLKLSIASDVNIYVSEQQIKIIDTLRKSVTGILTKISSTLNWCNNCTNDNINSVEDNDDDDDISNSIPATWFLSGLTGKNDSSATSSVVYDKCTIKINIDIKDNVTVNFFKNQEADKFEPLLYIRLHNPIMHSLMTNNNNNTSLHRIMLSDVSMYVPDSKTAMKSQLPNDTDYTISCIETYAESNITNDDSVREFLSVEFSSKHLSGYPEVKFNFKESYCVKTHTITMINILEIVDMFNRMNISEEEHFACPTNNNSNSWNDNLNNYDWSVNTIQSSDDYIKWRVGVECRGLVFQIDTETEDVLLLNVKWLQGRIDCVQETEYERTYRKITMENVTVCSKRVDLTDIILHPTRIVVKSNCYTSNSRSVRSFYKSNVTVSSVSIDLSKNNYDMLLSAWNVYKCLLETKHGNNTPGITIRCDDGVNQTTYHDDFAMGKFQIVNTSNVPLPYQIKISEDPFETFEITWTYPQFRKLMEISIEPKFIDFNRTDSLSIGLYWYDGMKTPHRSSCISHLFPKDNIILISRFELEEGISNTWRMIVNNKYLKLTDSEIRNFVSGMKITSYFPSNFALLSKIDVSIPSMKVNVMCDGQQSEISKRYKCVSDSLVKNKLALIKLNEIQIKTYRTQRNETVTSGKLHVVCKLNVFKKYMEFIELPINFTSTRTVYPTLRRQYNVQTEAIRCTILPSMISLLTRVTNFWFYPSYDIIPYVICNDTIYTIIFGQANTDENIVLGRLEYYNYSWRIYDSEHCLKFAIKNDDDTLCWSEENISLRDENKKYRLTFKDCDEQDVILNIHIQGISRISVKVVVTSTLRIINENVHFFDSRIILNKFIDDWQTSREHTMDVRSRDITPSLMFKPDDCCTLSIALRVSTAESQWSDVTLLIDGLNNERNEMFSNIQIPAVINNKSIHVLCHVFIEKSDEITEILILLLPPYVIRSYLPTCTTLNTIIFSNGKNQQIAFDVLSAIEEQNRFKEVQPLFLPIISRNHNTNLKIIMDLNNTFSCSPVSLSHSIKRNKKNSAYSNEFSIEQRVANRLNNCSMNTELRWPFVGDRFDDAQWHTQQMIPLNMETDIQIQNYYGIVDRAGVATRLITIRPWALVVNTTGQSIYLLSQQVEHLINVEHMSVIVPPLQLNKKTFSMKINRRTMKSPPMTIDENFFRKGEHVKRLGKRSEVVFETRANVVAMVNASLTEYQGTKILHFQSVYVATNYSSQDVVVQALCTTASVTPRDVFETPEFPNDTCVDLPKGTSRKLGKPLTLWSLVDTDDAVAFYTDELERYVIVASPDGRTRSCPIRLSDLSSENETFPAVFSSAGPPVDVCVTLHKRDDHCVIGVHDRERPPQLVFHNNCSATTVVVTNGFKYDTPVRFSANWNWSYEMEPASTSRLSFPESALRGTGVEMHLAVVPGDPDWFASMTLDSNACTAKSNEKIEINITKKTFTWHVVLCEKSDDTRTSLPNDSNVVDSLTSVNYEVGTMTFSLVDNEFYLKRVCTVTLENVITTITSPINDTDDEMECVLSIDDVEIKNNLFNDDDDEFDYPVIYRTKKLRDLKVLPYKQKAMCYLSQAMMAQSNGSNRALTTKLVILNSNHSTPGVLDLESFLSISEISIEDRYYDYLSNYLKKCNVMSSLPESDVFHAVDKSFIPIGELTLNNNSMPIRKFKLSSSTFLLNAHWSLTHLTHLQTKLPEFKRNNKTLHELGKNALTHYYKGLRNNAGIISIEQFGAPRNLFSLLMRGFRMFGSTIARGFVRGPKEFLFSLCKGSFLLFKHIALAPLYTVQSVANSGSRTLQHFESVICLKYISKPIINGLRIAQTSSEWAIGYILNSMDDGEVD